MNLIPFNEEVSTNSDIYSIYSITDYTSEEEERTKDYRIINEFTKNEFQKQTDDKFNQYGEILDELGYSLMNKTEGTFQCTHEIQFYVGPDHMEFFYC